ncbi:hypothetical protein EPN87_01840 [archaeon]|nr:MAG: hypothetical protein EPN87_01840 [archaeon]
MDSSHSKQIVLVFIFLIGVAFYVKSSYASSTTTSTITQTIQDVSSGLRIQTSPQVLNLTWNSNGNFSVHIENKNDMELICALTGGYLYNQTYSDGSYISGVYDQNQTVHLLLNPSNYPVSPPSTYDTVVNIFALDKCGPKEVCGNNNICHYEQYCQSDNSSIYLLKLSCASGYVAGSATGSVFDRLIVNFVTPETNKFCMENWNCTSWSSCFENRTQYKTCTDLNNCGTFGDKPTEIRSCTFTQPTSTITHTNQTTEIKNSGEQFILPQTGFFSYMFKLFQQFLHTIWGNR